ncbi:MAG: ORF6N domain-containing protein [Bacteroidetes bacterium]|nr:MAG: ORF6N domain-containing protein [Bacteroidota bacterium]
MLAELIQEKIIEVRGQKVMLDFDLAELYDTETKVLKQAVRRNLERFPADFMFELKKEEYDSLRSQSVTLENGRGKYSKYLPFAFTEHGVAMLSSVLKSTKAVEVNISIMRVFVFIRQYALSHIDLTEKLLELENKYDIQFLDVYEALKFLMDEKQSQLDWNNRKQIGF